MNYYLYSHSYTYYSHYLFLNALIDYNTLKEILMGAEEAKPVNPKGT